MKRLINLFVEALALPFAEWFAAHDPVLLCAKRARMDDSSQSGRSRVMEFDRCLPDEAITLVGYLNQTADIPNLETLQEMVLYAYRGGDIVRCADRHKKLKSPEAIINYYYLDRLMGLADSLLTTRNGYAVLRPWNTLPWDALFAPRGDVGTSMPGMEASFSPVRIELWNSLLRCLPEDLLLSCFVAVHVTDEGRRGDLRQVMLEMLMSFGETVQLSDALLDQVLEKGMAETHLHAGASRTFGAIWEGMTEIVLAGTAVLRRSEYQLPYKESVQRDGLRECVSEAIIARALLAGHLRSGQGHLASFLLCEPLSTRYNFAFRTIIEDIAENSIPQTRFCDLFRAEEPFWRRETECGLDIWWLMSLPEGMRDAHPGLADRFFLSWALAYVRNNPEDRYFTALLLYYLRKRNTAYRMRVQDGKNKGLGYFQKYYALSTDKGSLTLAGSTKTLLLTACRDPRVRKVELRFAPCVSEELMLSDAVRDVEAKMGEQLKAFIYAHLLSVTVEHTTHAFEQATTTTNLTERFDAHWRMALEDIAGGSQGVLRKMLNSLRVDPERVDPPRLGIVYHMIKRGARGEKGVCFAGKGETDRSRYGRFSFGNARYDYAVAVHAISNLRNRCPAIGRIIVGIDAASLEIPTEPWVFAPAFREAREGNGRWGTGERDTDRKPLLGLTYHVGEDFRHPLSGLRHIDEALTGLGMKAGDRIGHGLVLGVDLRRWQRRNGMVLMPRVEWMENGLWLWHLIATDYHHAELGKYGKLIEKQILDEARAIYGTLNGITIESLYQAYSAKMKSMPDIQRMADRHEHECEARPDCFKQLDTAHFFPCWRESGEREAAVWREDLLVLSYHCDLFLHRMNESVLVTVTPDQIEACEVLQGYLREKIAHIGVIVETNPSSNTAIGEMDGVLSHPVWSMRENDDSAVMATINTDDPSVFNATVANEYALVYYTLRNHGLEAEEALHQVDVMRRVALDTSFIRGNRPFYKVLDDYEAVLRELL